MSLTTAGLAAVTVTYVSVSSDGFDAAAAETRCGADTAAKRNLATRQ